MIELKSDTSRVVNIVEAETNQTQHGNLATNREALRISETRLAFYQVVSGIIGFTILRLLTDQEWVVILGTLGMAIIGMWILAYWKKARLISAALKRR